MLSPNLKYYKIMKIAVFLADDNLYILDKSMVQACTFRIENHLIISAGNELLRLKDINYVLLWSISRNIKEIYVKEIAESLQRALEKVGISIKSLEDIKTHPLLQSFLWPGRDE